MSARVLGHIDASIVVIYVSQKSQTVTGKVQAAPVGYRA
jgi:hypothetical protein